MTGGEKGECLNRAIFSTPLLIVAIISIQHGDIFVLLKNVSLAPISGPVLIS